MSKYEVYTNEDTEMKNKTDSIKSPIRLSLCVLSFAILFLFRFCYGTESNPYFAQIKREIRTDYTQQIIDFAKELNYTFDYEKISIK